jgi:hypothetical protein
MNLEDYRKAVLATREASKQIAIAVLSKKEESK